MKVLFLAPLPPPITGHSIAAKIVLDALTPQHEVTVVDLGKGSEHDGGVTWSRLRAVASLLREVWAGQRDADAIYLTISESLAGNLKDLAIYLLCAPRLDRMVIQLHGGTIGRELFDVRPVIRWLNTLAIRRMKAVLVSGESHLPIFAGMIAPERICMVPNFADQAMFVDESAIRTKFAARHPLRVLYVSAMIPLKGYDVLADAYLSLSPEERAAIRIDFGGKFFDPEAQARFETKIAAEPRMAYHGVVDNDTKAKLFAAAHVMCLPTAFKEGQPLAIHEAYASGCAVITTGQPGILDIFKPGVHGWLIEPQSVESTRDALRAVLHARPTLLPMALANREEAGRRFSQERFTDGVAAVITGDPSAAGLRQPLPGH